MWYKNIKLALIGFIFLSATLFVAPVFANIPDVEGYVRVNGTNAPVGNVWVKMTMSGCPWTSTPRTKLLPQSRYVKTDSNGHYLFQAMSVDDVHAQAGKAIDTDFDGSNDTIQFPTDDDCYPGTPLDALIWLFGCGRDPYLITVVKPYNWSGQFTSTGELSLLNDCPVGYCIDNNQSAKPVPTLYWKGNAPSPTRTPTPTPSPTRTPTPTSPTSTPTRTPTPTPIRTPTPTVGAGTPTYTPAPTDTPTPTVPSATPTRTPTPTPTLRAGLCYGVQHCTNTGNGGTTTWLEYCGDCSGAGCDPGYACRDPQTTCTTYITPPISFDTPYPLPCTLLTITPTPTEAPTHLSCVGLSCQAVSGVGADSCLPEGDSCQQTTDGCPSTCGNYGVVTQTCNCSGPCCPGTCLNGLSCGQTQTVACCNSKTPVFPTSVTITQPNGGSIIQTRFVKIDWSFADTLGCGGAWGFNCAGNNNRSFKIVIDDDQYFTSPLITKTNLPNTTRSYTTTAADGLIKDNKKYYVKVCAVNYRETCTIVNFTKQAYPVGVIVGVVGEYDGQSGQPFTNNGAGGDAISVNANVSSPIGVTSTCTETTAGIPPSTQSYSCNLTLDNVNNDPIPTQTITLSGTGYNPGVYTGICSQNGSNCVQPVTLVVNFDANGGTPPNITQNIYFVINSALTFFKIKNGSIQTQNSSIWSSYFPVSTIVFDSDDYTSGGNYLIIGNSSGSFAGVGTALFNTPVDMGNALVSQKSTPPYPPGKNWLSEGYLPITAFNAQRYLEYVRTRKQYQVITQLKDLQENVINVWNGDLRIDKNNSDQTGRNNFNAKNIVLVVTGTVSFNTDSFTPSGSASTAIIANQINFFNQPTSTFVTEAHGIFIGNTVNMGTSNAEIKIVGNIASTQNSINLTRVRLDNRKPSVFVVFDVDPYIDLLPYLSVAIYEWRQLQ